MDMGTEVQKACGAAFAPPGRRTAVRPGQSAAYRLFWRLFAALARLRAYLDALASPAGVLQSMKDRLADAQRDLRRANDPEERGRIENDIALLQQHIADQQRVVDDPKGAERRVEESIARGLERERQPEKPLGGVSRTKFINPPPGVAPGYFQNRFVETKLIGDFLQDESNRPLTVVGRAGIGKTAMVYRVLKAVEGEHLPDGRCVAWRSPKLRSVLLKP